MNNKVLVTGGAGFIGSHLVRHLIHTTDLDVVIFDRLEKPIQGHESRTIYYKGELSSENDVRAVFQKFGPFVTVYHIGAAMPDRSVSDDVLWASNVDGTRNVAMRALENGTRSFVFTSSNVTYGVPLELPVSEETPVRPIEIYGRSKVEAEKILEEFKGKMSVQILRCPVVAGVGRLGLQAILFEFISENKNVYVLGNGSNKYQFAEVTDVCNALEAASHAEGFYIYNIGADEVLSLKEMYQGVIAFAKSTSKIISIPSVPALFILFILDKLHLSPLGPYQYTMIGQSLHMDTTKIKSKLNWKSQRTNLDIFIENYTWYKDNKGTFVQVGSGNASSNRSLPNMGIFKILKWLS
ncbi:MAG: NAD(P)-dependent oxidoreductase [Candidatus Kaiserbacteria bacterium]|nr:NAD(P)-dependent oxidoreductase [Candidatus Kaiserbacteria bacterium]